MTTTQDVLVRGETAADLVAAVHGLTVAESAVAGMVSISGEIGDPVVRALMRIEAELLIADANGASPMARTEGQRRADAFCQLGHELASALGNRQPREH